MTALMVLMVVAVALLGLVGRPIGSRFARFAALLAVLVFAGAALDPADVGWTAAEPRRGAVALADGTAPPVEALVGGGQAGPRAEDLTIAWRAPLPNMPHGTFGARPTFPGKALPLQPEHVQLRALRAPAVGRPTVLELALDDAVGSFEALLTVRCAEQEVLHEVVLLVGGKRVEVAFTPLLAGPHTVAVAIDCAGHRVERTGAFEVSQAPRVLVVEPSGLCAAALRAQGVAVTEAVELPADFRAHRAVVVGDHLPAPRQQALAEAVADGMGLFVLAPGFGLVGEPLRALLPVRLLPDEGTGAGGPAHAGAPTQPPVDPPPAKPAPDMPDQPPAGDTTGASPISNEPVEVDKRSIAIVLVVDRSGSMGELVAAGKTKMSYAKTSALLTAEHLTEGDQVAVVTFGLKGRGRVELPLTDATDRAVVRDKIERLEWGDGGTFLLSGLREAKKLLSTSKAAVKHIVVVTDGAFDPSEGVALRAEARGIREECMASTTIISITTTGDFRDFAAGASALAKIGGGDFFELQSAQEIPVFVSAEVTRALSRVGRKPRDVLGAGPEAAHLPDVPTQPPPEPEKPREPPPPAQPPASIDAPKRLVVRAVAQSPLLAPMPEPAWPTLGSARPGVAPLDAQVLLVAGDAGWPLLAFANRGLGRTGAFAADLCGAAGSEFRAEPAFSARLAQWVQSVLPAEAMRAPLPLLITATVTPPAPTPRELDELARLAGSPAVPEEQLAAAAASVPVRIVQRLASPWSLAALLALLVLGVFERWLGLRAFHRG